MIHKFGGRVFGKGYGNNFGHNDRTRGGSESVMERIEGIVERLALSPIPRFRKFRSLPPISFTQRGYVRDVMSAMPGVDGQIRIQRQQPSFRMSKSPFKIIGIH